MLKNWKIICVQQVWNSDEPHSVVALQPVEVGAKPDGNFQIDSFNISKFWY